MSSCFLNLFGFFAGVDQHLFLQVGPLPPVPIPIPCVYHFAESIHPLDWLSFGTRVKTVTAGGSTALKDGWAMTIVPHVFIAGAPHPTEFINLARIILLGTSSPKLAASTVTGGGTPLLVEAFECVGVNLDCSEGWVGLGADLNVNSVKTTPTLSDYLWAAFWTAAGTLTNKWKGRDKKDDALATFAGKHRKGDQLATMSDALRRQLKASLEEARTTARDRLGALMANEALDKAMPDGVAQDLATGAIGTYWG
jgi:hypothetical protein